MKIIYKFKVSFQADFYGMHMRNVIGGLAQEVCERNSRRSWSSAQRYLSHLDEIRNKAEEHCRCYVVECQSSKACLASKSEKMRRSRLTASQCDAWLPSTLLFPRLASYRDDPARAIDPTPHPAARWKTHAIPNFYCTAFTLCQRLRFCA